MPIQLSVGAVMVRFSNCECSSGCATAGRDVYVNFNNVFLDCNTIRIGDRCLFGPNVQVICDQQKDMWPRGFPTA